MTTDLSSWWLPFGAVGLVLLSLSATASTSDTGPALGPSPDWIPHAPLTPPPGGLAGAGAIDAHQSSPSVAAAKVTSTLVLANNTLVPGNFLALNGLNPFGVAYDSRNGEVFVSATNSVSVISSASNRLVTSIPVDSPGHLVFDAGKGEVFVACGWYYAPGAVRVINDSTERVVATVGVGSGPNGLAYDSGKGEIFVANGHDNNVTVINDTTNSVVATVNLSGSPRGLAYDSGKGEVFVTHNYSDAADVISDTNNKVVATIALGSSPTNLAYDAGKGEIFVVNGYSNLSVISDSTNAIVTTVAVGQAAGFVGAGGWTSGGVAYDSGKGEIFATLYQASRNIVVVSEATNRLVANLTAGASPVGVAYVSGKAEVVVANLDSNNVTFLSDVTNKATANITLGSEPSGLAYDSAKRETFVTDRQSNMVSIVPDSTGTVNATIPVGLYPVAVTYDRGKGEMFVVNLDSHTVSVVSDVTNKVVATVRVVNQPMDAAYDRNKGEVFVTNWGSNNVSVINDTLNTVTTMIPVAGWPAGLRYGPVGVAVDYAKGEIFVANGGANSVSIISDSTNSVVATIPVGISPNGVVFDDATGDAFVANSGSHNVSVISDRTNTVVATVSLTDNPDHLAYAKVAGEVFATLLGSRSVAVISDSAYTLLGNVSVGSTPRGVAYDEAMGEIMVGNVYQGTISIISLGTDYGVSVAESGLPPETGWWVNVTGRTSAHSTTGALWFSEPNGSYTYTVAAADRTYFSPGGYFTVSGAAVSETVTFSRVTYSVAFLAVGLPGGTPWSVTLNGTLNQSARTTISFQEPNGTGYRFYVGPVTGYAPSTSGGLLWVVGMSVEETIWFYANPPPSFPLWFNESGLPDGTNWVVQLHWGLGSFGGTTYDSSQSASIEFNSPASSTYGFYVFPIGGYVPTPLYGSVTTPAGGASLTQSITFTHPAPSIAWFNATPSSLSIGSTVTFVTLVSQGQSPLSYSYLNLPHGCLSRNASTLGCVPGSTGQSRVTVTVTDALGRKVEANATVTVTPAEAHGSGATLFGSPSLRVYAIVGVIVGVVAMAIALAVHSSRRGKAKSTMVELPSQSGAGRPPAVP